MIMLYREGDTLKIRGIACDYIKTKPKELSQKLAEGWRLSVDELYPEPDIPYETFKEIPYEASYPDDEDLDDEDLFEVVDVQLSNKEIREKAEAAGIEDFATARINTLKAQLGV